MIEHASKWQAKAMLVCYGNLYSIMELLTDKKILWDYSSSTENMFVYIPKKNGQVNQEQHVLAFNIIKRIRESKQWLCLCDMGEIHVLDRNPFND